MEPWTASLLPGLAAFVALWPLSLALRDASVADAWWGAGFVAALLTACLVAGATGERAALLLALVGLWGARNGFTMIRRRLRHGAEDPRYAALRAAWGPAFRWKSLFVVFLLQAILQWLIALGPIAGALAPAAPLGPLAFAGAALALAGLALETRADAELDRFKRNAPPHALLTTGLRAHVRHPNYVGEIAVWWGLWLIAAEAGAWWAILSPILITFLLVKVSGAPATGEELARSKPGYPAWAARTPAFLPRRRRPAATPAE